MAITKKQFTTLNDLFDYYNETLFENQLPECLVNMSRHRGAMGFFARDRWKEQGSDKMTHEISINPDTMNRGDADWHSTLVHEMCHLWQHTFGKQVRPCYHDKQFAAKMEMVGLMPSDTGRPGGKKTGQSMSDYVIEGGPFETAFKAIDADALEALKLPYMPNLVKVTPAPVHTPGEEKDSEGGDENENENEGGEAEPAPPKSKNGVKVKYTCNCGFNVWGKPGLKLGCLDCETKFEPAE